VSVIDFPAMDDHATAGAKQGMRQGIQSVENAMLILQALERGGGPMTLSDVAVASGSQPNKVHRYLVSLVRVGLASQSPVSGRYDLGPAMRRLGAESLRRTNEVAVASEHTRVLRDTLGHSVNIAVWGDDGPIVVRWDYGSHALPLSVRVGATLPLLGSAAGRLFLAYLPERMTAAALAASQSTLRAPMDPEEVAAMIAEVRARGFATTSGGVIPGVSSVSVPIFTASDSLPLAITVVLPGEQLNDREFANVTSGLTETARRVSDELGAEPPGAAEVV
jgi:DNA-binding IclR family transcriptional regulator